MEHCHGTTTRDTSGRTLAQIEELLNELHVSPPPAATAAPAGEQHATQQTAGQSQNGDGPQLEVARQRNGTVQVVVTPAGAAADGGTGAGAVNQTAQGVIQLQVGCIFYCSGTRQTQRSDQSTATVQTVGGSAASAVNTVSRVVYQVQVGCIAWCHDAVETQTAAGTDSSVVSTAPAPTDSMAAVVTTPVRPAAAVPSPPPPSTGARTRYSGGAAVRAVGGGLGGDAPRASRPLQVLVATSQIVQIELPQRASYGVSRRGRHAGHHHRTRRPARTAQLAVAAPVPSIEPGAGAAQSTLELAVVLVLGALGIGVLRRVR